MAITSFGQLSVQKQKTELGLGKMQALKAQETADKANIPIPTGSEVLAKIVDEIKSGKVPAEIYPPGLLEQLEKLGDQPIRTLEQFDPTASALKAGDRASMSWMDPSFTMGSPTSEALRDSYETQHTVTLTSGFYMGKYPVTQGEYQSVIGSNPSYFTGDLNRPVETVSWFDATNYCHLLTLQERTAGHIESTWAYRLPTSAEWEYSCRAGTTTAFDFGNVIQGGDANFDTHYTYDASVGEIYVASPSVPYLARTDTVGNYGANPFGIFDMHGNVWEWCQDWFTGGGTSTSVIDPQGLDPVSSFRMIRGGSWDYRGRYCRSAMHTGAEPTAANFHIGFRIVLAPIVPLWKTAITAMPSQPTYGNCVTKGSGKNSLVLATHGWNPNLAWLEAMTNNIQQYLTSHSLTTWQVTAYKWVENASTGILPSDAQKALENAKKEGRILGDCIAAQGWTHVHLIAHSAGAALIQAVCERIKAISSTTSVHCTFLDPFVGFDYAGVSRYGSGADWAENYFSRDSATRNESLGLRGPFTESLLDHAYNVDVTQLDPNKITTSGFQSSATGASEPCTKTFTSHGWPRDFYSNTITGSVTTDYAGHGFSLSKEGGGWSSGVPSYTPGNDPAQILGSPDPTCTTFVHITPPSYVNPLIDFTQSPTIQSDTGTIQKWLDSLKLSSGSPAWLATVVSSTNPVNVVSFNTQFSSTNGAQGLLSVLWDEQVIGSIDERIVNTNHYTFRFPNAPVNSEHILGFRLDPFTNIQSVVTITNIVLNQVGVSQPFFLSLTGGTTNGALIYQLTGEAGFEYQVQASTNLVDWSDMAVLQNTNGTVRFYDQSSTNYPMKFYRGVAPY
ncbi:formylglycine-generating enzyme family protein [Candidatus Nomurabacteria bacterium]|nr:formylglycine-generating enzyme family protein [Candidatus Nomurabacteria bacterium]